MSELKPCPFCGGEAEYQQFANPKTFYMVKCTACGCRTEGYDCSLLKTDAENKMIQAEKWNRRPEPRQLTLDELLQMPDGYIWVEDWSEDLPFKAWGYTRDDKISILVWTDKVYGLVTKDLKENYYQKWYGKEWAAYDRLPGGCL
jgi:Lar family restriction alleviation protein